MILSELLLLTEELCRASVSVEIIDYRMRECPNLKLPQDHYLHHSESCRKIKFAGNFSCCRENKARSVIVAQRGRSFCGRCPHGIWEMAQPVLLDQGLRAIVYIGGAQEEPEEKRRMEFRRYGRFIAEFIRLELYRYFRKCTVHRKRRDRDFYLNGCRNFIEEKYDDPVSLADLAEELSVNANYLGKLIRNEFGKSFNRLLCDRRMKQSEVLVRLHMTLNITQIAHLCGFRDSNYFCVVFKEYFGLPPRDYRIRHGDGGDLRKPRASI